MSPSALFRFSGRSTRLGVLVGVFAVIFSVLLFASFDSALEAGLGGLLFAVMGWVLADRITRETASEAQVLQPFDSKTQFLATFETAAVGIAHVGMDYRWLRVNGRLCEITGYPHDELITKTFVEITHPDDRDTDIRNVQAMLAGSIPSYTLEKRYIRKDGSIVWVNLTVSLARDALRRPAYFISVVEDITARKATEAALRDREEQFRSTFDNAAVGIAHTGLDYRWLRVNEKLCDITGYSRDELLTKTFVDITHPDDLEADRVLSNALIAGEIQTFSLEKRYIRKDGSLVWVTITVSLSRDDKGHPVHFITVIEDISARKKAEEALRRSEDRFRIAAESMSDLVYEVDLRSGRFERFGDPESVLGSTREDLPPTIEGWKDLIHPDDRKRVAAELECAIAERDTFFAEYRVVRKDGSIRHWNDRGRILRNSDGLAVRWIGAVSDVTSRKQGEDNLRKSEELLRMATAVGRIYAFEWDPKTDTLIHSQGFKESLAVEEDTGWCTAREYISMIRPEDRARFLVARAALTPEADTYDITYQVDHPEGRTITFEERARGFFDEHGHLARLIGITADITARAEAERALRESEAEHRRILDNLFAFVGILELDGTIVYVNQAPLDVVGLTIDDVRGKKFWDAFSRNFSPQDQERIRDASARAMRGESLRFDCELAISSGDSIIIDFMLRPVRDDLGRITHLVPSAVDITDRKRTEGALREREERLLMATAAGRIITFEWDPVTDIVVRSETFGEILGVKDDAGQGTGKEFFSMIHPADRARLKALLWGLNPSANTYATTYRVTRPDGRVLDFEERALGLFDKNGRMTRVVGMTADITERKRAEEMLRESEERLSTVVEHLAEGLIIADSSGKIIHWNPAALAMMGYPGIDKRMREVPDFVDIFEVRSPEDGRRLPVEAWPMPRILRGEVLRDLELWVRRVDQGWEYLLSYSGAQIRSASGEMLAILSFVDITERRRAEEELSAAKEAAEAANRAKDDFLASLSHELRTPLNPVLILASEMERSDKLPPALREDFALIHKNIALEARLIDDLLDITRITRGKLQIDRRPVNAHEALNQALGVVHADLVQKRIAITLDVSAAESWVSADPVRLQQIFWNVLNNAAKFTPSEGHVTVRTSNVEGERTLRVEIIDTGIGMTPNEVSRAFTAFDQGEHAVKPGTQHRFGGLGLGLAICQQLVAMHGGAIHAYSAGRDKGATFSIDLPLAPAEIVPHLPTPATPPMAAPSSSRHLHILLVEDHEPTRTTLNRLLSRHGHAVECADSLAAARKMADDLATPEGAPGFDLLLSDLGLPDGSGHELMTELRNRYGARFRGIALSGFGMEKDIQRSLDCGFSKHLIKPVDIQALKLAIEREE